MKRKPFFITEERPHQNNQPGVFYRAYCQVSRFCDWRSKRVRNAQHARQAFSLHETRHHKEVAQHV